MKDKKNPTQSKYEKAWMQASAQDILNLLSPLSREEYDYYISLPDKK